MSFWGEALLALESTMPRQYPYGWYHITTTLFFIVIGFLLCRWPGGKSPKCVRIVLGVTSALVLLAEILKQILLTFDFNGVSFTADYQWFAFPFQFCSTPMYIGLIAALTKGRVHRACCDYLASFAVFAGVAVLVYPAEIYTQYILINVQTMVCHGSMLTLGIYLLKTGYVQCNLRTWRGALPVFLINVSIAVVMNEIAFRSGVLETDVFNMFFISPYCEPTLAVYSWVQAVVPFPWCLAFYILGFSAAAGLVLLCAKGLRRLGRSIDKQ